MFGNNNNCNNSTAKRYVYESNKQYSFNLSKVDPIFNHLLKRQFIRQPDVHKISSEDELKKQRYYKWHNSWCQLANNYVVFRYVTRENIQKGMLQFPMKGKETMGIDTNPFLPTEVNMVSVELCSLNNNYQQGESNDLPPKVDDPLKVRF